MYFRVEGHHNIKVADFGLAKDIYTCGYYRSKQRDALPVKWMSPESLLDDLFDEKTDVVCILYIDSYTGNNKSDTRVQPYVMHVY